MTKCKYCALDKGGDLHAGTRLMAIDAKTIIGPSNHLGKRPFHLCDVFMCGRELSLFLGNELVSVHYMNFCPMCGRDLRHDWEV